MRRNDGRVSALLKSASDLLESLDNVERLEPERRTVDVFLNGVPATVQVPLAKAVDQWIHDRRRETPWSGTHSYEDVQQDFVAFLVRLRDEGEMAARLHLTELMSAAELNDQVFVVSVPIIGLELEIPEFNLAGVAFRRFDIHQLRRLQKSIDAKIARRVGEDATTMQRLRAVRDSVIPAAEAKLLNKTCAFIDAQARSGQARVIALERLRQVLEVLTFVCASQQHEIPESDLVIAIEGEALYEGPIILVEGSDSINASQHTASTVTPIIFGADSAPALPESILGRLTTLMLRVESNRSDLERSILRAVHWWATAQRQVEPENKLLNLITAAETLTGRSAGQNSGGISHTVAESIAFLTENELADRERVYAFVSKVYTSRSKFAHGSSSAIILDEDLWELRRLVAESIKILLRKGPQFRTRAQLFKTLDRMRLAGASWNESSEVFGEA